MGANAILAVSLAAAVAYAHHEKMPLFAALNKNEKEWLMPIPQMNVLNGGVHADNNVDIQELMIMPVGAPNFAEALRMGAEVFHVLKTILKKNNLATSVGDEGGFAPNLHSNEHGLDLLSEAVLQSGLKLGYDIFLL